MLSEKMVKSINHQINREHYSAYLYLSMASYAAAEGLNGFANWFTIQMKEEMFHAEKMYNYVNQQGSRVLLIDKDLAARVFTVPVATEQ